MMNMTNNSNNNNFRPKKDNDNLDGCGKTFLNIFAWLFSICSFIIVLAEAIEGKMYFIFLLMFAILITPPLSKKIEKVTNLKNYGLYKGISCLFLYLIYLSFNISFNQNQEIFSNNNFFTFAFFSLILFLIVTTVFAIKFYLSTKNLKTKYSSIINIDDEIEKRLQEDNNRHNEISKKLEDLNEQIANLKTNYKSNKAIYDELIKRKELLEEDVEMMVVGLYQPHFNFDDSSTYKNAITKNFEKQKALVKNKKAIICHTEWTVEGSKSKGQQMINRNIKLMLKAFNGECDSIISKTKWNNIDKMEVRIEKAFDDINKLGEPNQIDIQHSYLQLKLEELYLTYEYEVKKQEEKEEQKRIQEQIREEQKAQKELEAARIKAEKEEADFQKALQKAHEELAKANAEERSKYEAQIAQLQQELKEAEERKQRAISQAQLTKCGHIYVISNIGSFGENVYKIGMTRRLDPMERINELGDASVPFKFDVHAMIFSEDAPALENKLHETFRDKSVNMVNMKKEFFRVSLEEIEKVVKDNYAEIEFTKIAEAKDYRETLAILKAKEKVNNIQTENKNNKDDLPVEL